MMDWGRTTIRTTGFTTHSKWRSYRTIRFCLGKSTCKVNTRSTISSAPSMAPRRGPSPSWSTEATLLLVPPRAEDAVALATTITISGKADKEWTAVGCRELLAAGDPAAPLVPGKRGRCTRCADVGSKKKVVELPGAPDGGAGEDVQGGLEPLYRRPSFAYGAVCQEIFAGGAGWSREKQVSPSKVIKYCACNK